MRSIAWALSIGIIAACGGKSSDGATVPMNDASAEGALSWDIGQDATLDAIGQGDATATFDEGAQIPNCIPLDGIGIECPQDWKAALAAQAQFCSKFAPFYDTFLSTKPCNGFLHFTRYLDLGPRYCFYDPSTFAIAGLRDRSLVNDISCGSVDSLFDDKGCEGVTCRGERDASANASSPDASMQPAPF